MQISSRFFDSFAAGHVLSVLIDWCSALDRKRAVLLSMRKSEAVSIFGRTQSDLARALGITKSAVSQWPDELDQEKTDRVLGAALRLGVDMPAAFIGYDAQLRSSNETGHE